MKLDPLEEVKKKKRIEQAQECLMAGNLDEASAIFEALLGQQPDYSAALHGMGLICVQKTQFTMAENWLRKSVEADPNRPVNWNDLGEALRLLGRGEEAASAYRRALELQPEFAEAMNNLAVVMAGSGDMEEAKRLLEKAIEIAPDDPSPYNNLGVIMESEGRADEALRYYEEAVRRRADFQEAMENYTSLIAREPERLMDSMQRLLESAKQLND